MPGDLQAMYVYTSSVSALVGRADQYVLMKIYLGEYINFFHADEMESFCDRQGYEQHLANKGRPEPATSKSKSDTLTVELWSLPAF